MNTKNTVTKILGKDLYSKNKTEEEHREKLSNKIFGKHWKDLDVDEKREVSDVFDLHKKWGDI